MLEGPAKMGLDLAMKVGRCEINLAGLGGSMRTRMGLSGFLAHYTDHNNTLGEGSRALTGRIGHGEVSFVLQHGKEDEQVPALISRRPRVLII